MVCVWCIGCDGERKFATFLSPICVVHGCNVLNKRDALNLDGGLISRVRHNAVYLIPIVSLWLYEGLEVS